MKFKYTVYQTIKSSYLAGQHYYQSARETVIGEYYSPKEAIKVKNETEEAYKNNPDSFDEWYGLTFSSDMLPCFYERLSPPIHECKVEIEEAKH